MDTRPRIAFLVAQLEFDGTYPDLLVKAALGSAEARGCDVLVVPGREWGADWGHEGVLTAVYRLLPRWPLDAVIISAPVANLWTEEVLVRESAYLAGIPLVSMGVPLGPVSRVDNGVDRGVGLSVNHLVTHHGRRRIALLRGPRSNASAEARYREWASALASAGLEHGDELVGETEFKEEGTSKALADLLLRSGPIDGLVCANDLVARAAVRELTYRGFSVPGQVSVIGYDNLPLGADADPPLTSVDPNLAAQVDAAFGLAVALAEGRDPGPNPRVDARLVIRRSCGCFPDHPTPSPPPVPTLDLQRRLERLATFNLGLGLRQNEHEFHQWLGIQLPHQGWAEPILALVASEGDGPGHHAPATDPTRGLPEPPGPWVFPLDHRSLDSLWGPDRRSRVVLPLAADRTWYGLLVLDLDADGALVYRGIQEALTRRYRELYERTDLWTRSLEQETARRVEGEKMRALGTLVAGVAHEVNTPLGNAIMAASFLDEHLRAWAAGGPAEPGLLLEASGLLRKDLARAADLVVRFKRVAVERTHDPLEWLDLTAYIEDLVPSLAFPLRQAGIDLVTDLDPGLGAQASPGALFDIFMALVQNVLDHAYPEGGPGQVRLTLQAGPGDERILTFADHGRGMDEEVRQQIFEPFFTTTRGQGGTGLGLHVVYNLVHQRLGGTLTCHSAPGAGTRFRITLPASSP